MSTQLASISNRLTSAQAQLLERSRVISLGIMPSPASTHSLVRTLTAVRGDLAKLSEEATFERTGLALGGSQGPGKASSGADAMALGELEARYDRLVDMLQADDDGRERAKALVRDKRCVSGYAGRVERVAERSSGMYVCHLRWWPFTYACGPALLGWLRCGQHPTRFNQSQCRPAA